MLDALNETLGGENVWNEDLNIGLDRLAALGLLSYAVGFFPPQWAQNVGILNDSPTQLFFAIYATIALITLTYMTYEANIERDDHPEPVPFAVRSLLVYFMNLSSAFFLYILFRMFGVVNALV